MRRIAIGGIAALMLLGGCRRDVSGSYLADDKQAVCWLQVVRTPDDHVTGQIIFSTLKPDGQIEHESVSLTGAVNGENITLTGGGFLGMSSASLSGTFNRDSITLAGAPVPPFILKRATLAEYQAHIEDQNTRSRAIIAEKAEADARRKSEEAEAEARQAAEETEAEARQRASQAQETFIAQVDRLIGRMQRFDAEADVSLGRFPNIERGYEGITAKVNEYVTRERQLAGSPNRGVDRSQLYVAANQVSLNTDQVHAQGQSSQSSLETNIAPLLNEETALEQECRPNGPVPADLTPAAMEAIQSACGRLTNAAPVFRQKYNAVSAGLGHLESVYRYEKDAQDRLLAEAQRLE